MRTFLKHIKKHTLTIILVIIFLFIQAMCDLSLPDYTANIVDVGIRQSGIEDNVFESISEEQLKKINLFLTEEEQNIIQENYELDGIYKLKQIDDETRKKLSEILINPEITIQIVESETGKNKQRWNQSPGGPGQC